MKTEAPSNPRGLPGAQVAQVLEVLNYQDGAVVSRDHLAMHKGSALKKLKSKP